MSDEDAKSIAMRGEAPELSRRIAAFLSTCKLEDAPAEAGDLARLAFTDTIGVMLAGGREPPGKIAAEMVQLEGGAAEVPVVGRPFRTSVSLAAFANGVAAHAMDYDFSYAIGQSAAPIIPSLLALAPATGASAASMIEAFVAGCEVASRLAKVVPNLSNGYGWHAAGTVGAVAAAAACAKLLHVPREAIPDVIGISASMAAGLGVNYGTMTKPLHVGQAARNAIVAARLGSRGFTSAADALEGRTGFIELFAPPFDWPRDAFDDLGRTWDLVERGLTVKLYPCGGLLHTGIGAALQLRERVDLSDIRSVHVGVTAHAGKRARRTQFPETVERAKFSMQYVVAYTLVHGAPMLEAFTDDALADKRVRAVFSRVTAGVDEAFADTPNQGPARITATIGGGQTIVLVQQHAIGTPQQPLSSVQLKGKFVSCATHAVTADKAEELFNRLQQLSVGSPLANLWPLLTV